MFCPQCGSTQSDELKFCKQIPPAVGAALIFNGIFVSKQGREKTLGVADLDTKELEKPAVSNYLSAADTSELASGVPFSVTDETTRHLHQKIPTREK